MNSHVKYATFLFPSRQLSGDKEIDRLCSLLMHARLTVSHGQLPLSKEASVPWQETKTHRRTIMTTIEIFQQPCPLGFVSFPFTL